MLNDLPIDQLRTFVTIAEMGSYTRAAEQLDRTQPALSLQIKRLENQLGTRLFDRRGRHTDVTEAGRLLLSYAHRILDLNQEALAKLSVVDTEGSVQVGILEEVALGPLVGLLTQFGRLCSKIQMELQVSSSWELAAQIKANTLCLAVANGAYTKDPVIPLWHEQYVWAANPAYDFQGRETLPLIMDPMSCPCIVRDVALSALTAAGCPWTIAFSSASLAVIQAAIRAGLGIGLIAESALTPDMQLIGPGYGLPDLPPYEIALYRGTEATSAAADSLADFLISHLQTQTPALSV